MKGNNDLILNQATMIEALQYWLDSRMVPNAPKVNSVKETGDPNVTFKVSLTDRDVQLTG